MERRVINPWTWQDQFGFVQANEVSGASRTLICSGQTAIDSNGAPRHAGDVGAQAALAMDNLETVLKKADFTLADVVRLTIYTTDVDALLGCYGPLATRLAEAECHSAQTLLGVARLAFPDLMIEIEATAMK
jgi:enamine deaminase RidA (YjgF/YER057c/UK114 family)